MYTFEEVETALNDKPLSDALYMMQRYAESQGFTDLARWCSLELNGYKDTTEDERKEVDYRSLNVQWTTIYNTPVEFDESFAFLRKIDLWANVSRLESISETRSIYGDAGLLARLNQFASVPIKGAILPPELIKGLLSRIRHEARTRFHDSVPRVPARKTTYPAPNFGALVNDVDLVRVLSQRWAEANIAFEGGAYLLTVIALGSILEGVLLAKAQQNPADANRANAAPNDRDTGKPLPFGQWSLSDLINVAHECGWLQKQYRDFSHVVRDYRNFVHPNEERRQGITVDANTCRVVWEVVSAALSQQQR